MTFGFLHDDDIAAIEAFEASQRNQSVLRNDPPTVSEMVRNVIQSDIRSVSIQSLSSLTNMVSSTVSLSERPIFKPY